MRNLILLTLFLITNNTMYSLGSPTIVMSNAYITEAKAKGESVCIFFDAKIIGETNDKNAFLYGISTENSELINNANSSYKIIKRVSGSNISSCNESGDILTNLNSTNGFFSLSPLNVFVKFDQTNKPLALNENINLTVTFKINDNLVKSNIAATVLSYDRLRAMFLGNN